MTPERRQQLRQDVMDAMGATVKIDSENLLALLDALDQAEEATKSVGEAQKAALDAFLAAAPDAFYAFLEARRARQAALAPAGREQQEDAR